MFNRNFTTVGCNTAALKTHCLIFDLIVLRYLHTCVADSGENRMTLGFVHSQIVDHLPLSMSLRAEGKTVPPVFQIESRAGCRWSGGRSLQGPRYWGTEPGGMFFGAGILGQPFGHSVIT